MNNLKIVLYDDTEVELQEFSLPMKVVVLCNTKEDLIETWDKFSAENLSLVEIQLDGITQQRFENVQITGVQSVINADETMTVHFYMNGVSVSE